MFFQQYGRMLAGGFFLIGGIITMWRGRITVEGTGPELTGVVAQFAGLVFVGLGMYLLLTS